MQRKTKKITKKKARALHNLYYDVNQDLKTEPTCPYCGKRMILKKGSDINSTYKDQMQYVCQGYPACNVYCRADFYKGSWRMVSTPADEKLRQWRREAHFWMDKLIEAGICKDMKEVYWYISNAGCSVSNGKQIHIGQCREYGCMEISTLCIKILYQNRSKFKPFQRWRNTSITDKDILKMIDEITVNE